MLGISGFSAMAVSEEVRVVCVSGMAATVAPIGALPMPAAPNSVGAMAGIGAGTGTVEAGVTVSTAGSGSTASVFADARNLSSSDNTR